MPAEIVSLLPPNLFLIQFNSNKLWANPGDGKYFVDIELVGIKKFNLFELEMSGLIETLNFSENYDRLALNDELIKTHQNILKEFGLQKFRNILNENAPI